jgi:hypothetical protein
MGGSFGTSKADLKFNLWRVIQSRPGGNPDAPTDLADGDVAFRIDDDSSQIVAHSRDHDPALILTLMGLDESGKWEAKGTYADVFVGLVVELAKKVDMLERKRKIKIV